MVRVAHGSRVRIIVKPISRLPYFGRPAVRAGLAAPLRLFPTDPKGRVAQFLICEPMEEGWTHLLQLGPGFAESVACRLPSNAPEPSGPVLMPLPRFLQYPCACSTPLP